MSSAYYSASVNGAAAFLPLLLIFLIAGLPSAIMTMKLAARKGYTGYFWTGFFFNLTGLIYVGFLPNKSSQQ